MAKNIISYDQDLPEIPGRCPWKNPDSFLVKRAQLDLETTGRVWEGPEAKDDAINLWCERITEQTGKLWKFFRINQVGFEAIEPKTLMEIAKGSEPREGKLF